MKGNDMTEINQDFVDSVLHPRDVYKRQGFLINRGGATCDDMLRLIELVQNRVREPVSYTHLDVYKRQQSYRYVSFVVLI